MQGYELACRCLERFLPLRDEQALQGHLTNHTVAGGGIKCKIKTANVLRMYTCVCVCECILLKNKM